MMQLAIHPFADVFPLMVGADFDDFVADIKQNGQHLPIVTIQEDGVELILDGRNRDRACRALGIEPKIEHWAGDGSPIDFVLSTNLHRRQLSPAQRAMIAARIANLRHGERADYVSKSTDTGTPVSAKPITCMEAAKLVGATKDSITRARTILAKCAPEDIALVDAGKLSLSRAVGTIKGRAPIKAPEKNGPSTKGKNPDRIARMQQKNKIWRNVKTALEAITSLPLASDVAPIAKAADRNNIIAKKLPSALAWLTEFAKCQ
jgi:hypothetical protein